MKKVVILLLGALSMLACSRNEPSDRAGSATITGGSMNTRPPSAEEIRGVLRQARPNAPEVNNLLIRDDNGMVTLQGVVPDDQVHADIVSRVRSMPNVTNVRDEIKVAAAEDQQQQQQQPGATGMGGNNATPSSDTVRASMKRDAPKDAAIIDQLIIADDGNAILIHGVVPDEHTHKVLLRSAEKSAVGKKVNDEMRVSGSNKK
jgi:osmotically-inducible protein OsmY